MSWFLRVREVMVVSSREQAYDHWGYTEKIIIQMLSLAKILYVEAFQHGYGHGIEDAGSHRE